MSCCGCTDVDTGGGSGTGGVLLAFTFTATGAEGSDFFITLPVALGTDNYIPLVVKGGGVQQELYDFKMPDDAAADRTTTQFRIVTAADVRSGDKLDVVIVQRS